MEKQYTDAEITGHIREGGPDAGSALKQLYAQNRKMFYEFLKRNNGTEEEAKDLLQDAIITFYEQVRSGKYEQKSKLSTYLYSIARFMWMNKLKRKKIERKFQDTQSVMPVAEELIPQMIDAEKEKQIKELFAQLGDQCRKVLELSFYHNYSMKEICEATTYDNEQVVRNKKYKCIKALRTLIDKNPSIREILKGE